MNTIVDGKSLVQIQHLARFIANNSNRTCYIYKRFDSESYQLSVDGDMESECTTENFVQLIEPDEVSAL